MSIREETKLDEFDNENLDFKGNNDSQDDLNYDENIEQESGFNLKEFIMTETGNGEVSEYTTHPLNFNKSEGMARILRGLTGFFKKSLKLAIIDILVGTYQLMGQSRKAVINE